MPRGATSVRRRIPHIRLKASEACISSRIASQRGELLAALAAVGPLRVDRIPLPGTTKSTEISRPAAIDHLIDAAAADPEQNLPYWAELWPSGIALAARLTRHPEIVRGRRVLELGCGLGVTAIAALDAGADLLVTDYSSAALSLCALNALDRTGQRPETLRVNWREPNTALITAAGEGFPVVLAADVLYEGRDVEPLLAICERLVAPGGELWLAEPGRPAATRFMQTIRAQGWSGEDNRCAGPWPDPEDNHKGVVVTIHRLQRPLNR